MISSNDTTLIGDSAASQTIREDIAFAARADAKVLVTGETGVGKDLVARLIHDGSRRRLAPMASINCAGLPDTLLESELFGHVRGSFTDAWRDKPGLLESASNGTVFLDEVGEMSARMQAVLLRFLETGELQRVGADRVHAKANVRVIAATNRDLTAEMQAGRFREDLYYRLNVVRIHVPPLRERRDDIALLVQHYLAFYSARHGTALRTLTGDAIAELVALDWPGNVRQVKNAAERLVLKSASPSIDVRDLPEDLRSRRSVHVAPAAAAAVATTAAGPAVVADLLSRMLDNRESFWSVVYAPFMERDLTRAQLTELISHGLERTAGNYRSLVVLFNMPERDYKRFLAFLSKHRCHLPFRAYRSAAPLNRRLHVTPEAPPHAQAVGM
jgi:DNA-binding NtrC family response regulator